MRWQPTMLKGSMRRWKHPSITSLYSSLLIFPMLNLLSPNCAASAATRPACSSASSSFHTPSISRPATASSAENCFEKRTISRRTSGYAWRLRTTAIIPGGKCNWFCDSLVLKRAFPPTKTQSCAKANMHPPATAPPRTRHSVGNGNVDNRPSSATNYIANDRPSQGYRCDITLRSIPPLNSLERESVMRAVGPSLASTWSSAAWMARTKSLVKVFALVLSSMQKTSPRCLRMTGRVRSSCVTPSNCFACSIIMMYSHPPFGYKSTWMGWHRMDGWSHRVQGMSYVSGSIREEEGREVEDDCEGGTHSHCQEQVGEAGLQQVHGVDVGEEVETPETSSSHQSNAEDDTVGEAGEAMHSTGVGLLLGQTGQEEHQQTHHHSHPAQRQFHPQRVIPHSRSHHDQQQQCKGHYCHPRDQRLHCQDFFSHESPH